MSPIPKKTPVVTLDPVASKLATLGLDYPASCLPDLLEQCTREQLSPLSFLELVLTGELEARTHRITHWRTSDQKLRWCAAALWAMERQFRRVKNYRHLPLLKQALHNKLVLTSTAA